jgi:acetylornithine deacetylase/succinyl-diaminopimelate desuccinylase-like protein
MLFSRENLFNLFEDDKKQIIEDYFKFLRFESVSSEPDYKDQTLKCCDWLENYLRDSGLKTERWETTGYPTLFAEWNGAKGKDTVLIYGHYDVQPVDPLELWKTPPFEPTVRDGQVFARGAQDNKGQCFYVISVIRQLLKKNGTLPVNVKICIEGEEEIGSPGLSKILKSKKESLRAEHALIVDFGIPDLEQPAISIGMRGIVTMTVTVTGSNTDLHSGTHGGIVYNPNHALVQILSKFRDENGTILIPGYYDDIRPIDKKTKDNIFIDFDEAAYSKTFGAEPVGGELSLSPLESCWFRPTLEVNGLGGGYSGGGFKTVIPAKAIAKVSCRLVPDQDPEKVAKLVKSFIEESCPKGVSVEVYIHPGIGRPVRTTTDTPVITAAFDAYSEINQKKCSFILEGASVPIVYGLKEACGGEVVMFGYALPTDQIHAPNEHFGLDRFKLGFATIAKILDLLSV